MKEVFIGTIKELRKDKFFLEKINSFQEDQKVKIEIKKYQGKRSRAQNKLYWGYYLEYINKNEPSGQYETPEEWHEFFKWKFLRKRHKKAFKKRGWFFRYKSTKELNKKEFSEYIEKICDFIAKDLEFYIPKPADPAFEKFILECESLYF